MKQICYCIKNFYLDSNYTTNTTILFEKGKSYEFEKETYIPYFSLDSDIIDEEKCAWVIFNKNGKGPNIGRRFFFKKFNNSKSRIPHHFYEFFEHERTYKLKKINEKYQY